MNRVMNVVKGITIVAFMVTLYGTYHIRSEVLQLNRIRSSYENVRAEQGMRENRESYPSRIEEYEVQKKNYDLEKEHYGEMLKLYRTDYDAYVARVKDRYRPPQLPVKPNKPEAPELGDRLAQIHADFRSQQFSYFDQSIRLNWVCCVSSLVLVGGLLALTFFETGLARIVPLTVLGLSFVFMIGPSFHSIMSAIVGFLRPPMGG